MVVWPYGLYSCRAFHICPQCRIQCEHHERSGFLHSGHFLPFVLSSLRTGVIRLDWCKHHRGCMVSSSQRGEKLQLHSRSVPMGFVALLNNQSPYTDMGHHMLSVGSAPLQSWFLWQDDGPKEVVRQPSPVPRLHWVAPSAGWNGNSLSTSYDCAKKGGMNTWGCRSMSVLDLKSEILWTNLTKLLR